MALRPVLWSAVVLTACGPIETPDGDAGVHHDSDISGVGSDTFGADLGPLSGCSEIVCGRYACNTDFDACRTDCETSLHCAANFVCENRACIGTACTTANAREVCGPYACVQGECDTTCGSSGCAPDFYCRGDIQRCVPRCTEREDPRCEGFLCDTTVGECEPYCQAGDVECAATHVCDAENRCIPKDD